MLLMSSALTTAEERLLALLQIALQAAGLGEVTPMVADDGAFDVAGVMLAETSVSNRAIGGLRLTPAWYIYVLRYDGGDRETPPDYVDEEIATVTSDYEAVKAIVLRLVTDRIDAALASQFPAEAEPDDFDREGLADVLEFPFPREMSDEDYHRSDRAYDEHRERRR